MAESKSYVAKLAVSTNDVAYDVVGGVRDDISFDGSAALIDDTTRDDGEFTSNKPGRKTATMSFTAQYDPANAGQAAIVTAYDANNQIYVRYRPAGDGGGLVQRKQIATITSCKISSPGGESMNLLAVSVQFSGDFSQSLQ